jgi:hypothetical protein
VQSGGEICAQADFAGAATLMETKCMLLFDIAPLHSDALLVSFNEFLYPFENLGVWLLTKRRLHRLLDVTM